MINRRKMISASLGLGAGRDGPLGAFAVVRRKS